jgi:hypothetical protein
MSSTQEVGDIFGAGKGPSELIIIMLKLALGLALVC